MLIYRTPPYVGQIFGPLRSDRASNAEHGRLSGFTFHVDQDHAIVHRESLGTGDGHKLRSNGHIMIPAEETIHVNRQGSPIAIDEYSSVQRDLVGSHFNLAKFQIDGNYLR